MSDTWGGRDEVQRIDRAVARLAATQHGVFAPAQAAGLGAGPSLIKRRRGSGRWLAVAPGVLAMAGVPATELQRRWIVNLSLGEHVAISHEWAGRAQGMPALRPDIWSVTVPPSDHRPRAGFVVHQQRLEPVDLVEIDGFRMTAVPRTVCDLSMVVGPARLKRIVEAAHFDLGVSFASMGLALLRVGTVGRTGATSLAGVLDVYGPGDEVAASALEGQLGQVLDLAGLTGGIAQYPLPGTGRRTGLVDRAYPEAMLIVEADGRRWHARVAAMPTDRQRDLEAGRVGWQTIRLVHEQLYSDAVDTAAALAETYATRLRPAV